MRSLSWATALIPLALVAAESPSLRLDEATIPTHYSVQLALTPDSNTFDGSIDIDVTLAQARSTIWLNALDLDLKTATVAGRPAKIVTGKKGFAGFEMEQPIAAGPARIHVDYSGKINRNDSTGVFQLADGKRWYVFTQFESIDARRAFPCFDQPSIKTPWDIALKVRAADKAFANTPELSSTPQADGTRLVRFATTRPLPSYLIALAVGPFDVVDIGKAGRNKTPLRIVLPKGHTGETEFASTAIPQLLKQLEDYFGIPFPYAKLDSVVMPISNFAMENAGLITYGSSMLLSSPKDDSLGRQRGCASVVAHEMAHQWFGDLVTTAWWDDIWLNEAFATWMSNKIVERWRPEWRFDLEATESMLGVMRQDSLATARRIRQPIESEDDIANAFDGITYQKGAAVINMFEHSIGEERFRSGVRLYLEQNADHATTVRQFLAALEKAGARDIAPSFSSFLDRPGTPVISLELECGKGTPQVTLQQSRYAPIGSTAPRSEVWSVPVCIRYQADGKTGSECTLLTGAAGEISLTRAKSCPAWVVGNDGEHGYYRVAYQGGLLTQLVRSAAGELSTAETIAILSDVRALTASGNVPPAEALSLVPVFAGAKERQVAGAATSLAGLAVARWLGDETVGLGRRFVLANFGDRARALGWQSRPGESNDDKLLRETVVAFTAREGRDRVLVEDAKRLARTWLTDHSVLDPDVVRDVLSTAAESGDAALFDDFLAAAKAAKGSQERRRMLGALGSFRDPALARRAMGLLLTGQFDMREAFYPLLFGPMGNRETERLPFEFVRNHIDQLLKVLPGEVGSDYTGALPQVGGAFCDAASRREVSDFFSERVKSYTGGPRTLAQTLEGIDLCIQQKAKLSPAIRTYLQANVNGSR